MTSTHPLRLVAVLCVTLACSIALGDEKSPTLTVPSPSTLDRAQAYPRTRATGSHAESTGGWWIGSAIIAGAFMVVGGLSLASKRFLPTRESGPIQVVGRSSLSPKHSVALLRVGGRVLIVGIGPQGAPSMLGEVTDPAELAKLTAGRTAKTGFEASVPPRPSPSMARSTGFDRRIGDDE